MDSLFNRSFGGGLETGRGLADMLYEGRQRRIETKARGSLSELLRSGGDLSNPMIANQAAGTFANLGNFDQAFKVAGQPAEMQRLEAERQNEIQQQNIKNQLGFGNLDLRGRELDARLDPQSTFNNKPKGPLTGIGKIYSDLRNGVITQQQAQALIAQETAGKNGVTVSPDGTVQIGGSPNLGKKAVGKLQGGAISNTELLDQMENVGGAYSPEFLTYKGQGQSFFTAQAEKLGIDAGSAQKSFLKDRTKFTTGVERLFNAYRKEITGAAAAVQELDRLKKSFINIDMSPTEFEAAFESYQDELKRTLRLRNRILREGLDPRTQQGGNMLDNLHLTGGDDDIEARGQELTDQDMNESEVLAALEREGYGS